MRAVEYCILSVKKKMRSIALTLRDNRGLFLQSLFSTENRYRQMIGDIDIGQIGPFFVRGLPASTGSKLFL